MLLALACTKCVAACSCPEGIYRLLSQVAATAVSYLIARGHKWGADRGSGTDSCPPGTMATTRPARSD